MSYLSLLSIMAASRAADILSTWMVSPDMSKELNPIMKRAGWFWSIVISAILSVVAALDPIMTFPIATVSLLCAGFNCTLSTTLSCRVLMAASFLGVVLIAYFRPLTSLMALALYLIMPFLFRLTKKLS